MAEWLKAAVLKTVDGKPSVGSNPTSSATFFVSISTMKEFLFYIYSMDLNR